MAEQLAFALRTATSLQAGMAFHSHAAPESGVDIEQIEIELGDEHFDLVRFVEAFNRVIAHHDVLRTAFIPGPRGKTKQAISEGVTLGPVLEDWTELDDDEQNVRRDFHKSRDRHTDFDLTSAPLLRLFVARESGRRTWILWSFHHALLDGRSFPLVLNAVFDLYDLGSDAGPIGMPFDRYVDAVARRVEDDAAHQTAFWREYLGGLEHPTTITLSAPIPEADLPAVLHEEIRLSADETSALRQLASACDVSVNNAVQAAWILLLHHYSQTKSVVTGTTRACRNVIEGCEDMIGLLINTIPLRVDVTPEMSVADLLRSVKREQYRLRDVETTPLPAINAASPLGSTALFDSIVMFDEATLDSRMAERLGRRGLGRRFTYSGQTNFDFTLMAYNEDEFVLRLEYSTVRITHLQARKLLDEMVALLDGFAADPTFTAVGIEYLTPDDRSMLERWNGSAVDYDLTTTLPDLFAAQASRTPDLPAFSFGDSTLTYTQFDHITNRLGHHLQGLGVTADVVVGVCAERSMEMLIAVHGIHKAGGAYVPLDPDHPTDRLAYMVDNAEVGIVLSQGRFANRFAGKTVVVIDDGGSAWSQEPSDPPARSTGRHDLAYTLYTSGSTGRPKGAMNEHAGIVNRLSWMQDAFRIGPDDIVLQKTPFSFDVSVWELFWPTIVGAHTVIAPPSAHRDPAELAHIISGAGVTTMHFVPSMLQIFLSDPAAAGCTTLRKVICSGEALTRDLQDRFFTTLPNCELHNLYGPTEAAIDVTWWRCDPNSTLSTVPIGRAIANTQIHIVDPQLRPLPIGVPGELHIGGVQVARGYRNNPELTAAQFVADPFRPDCAGARLYKTGDLARFMADGNLEYLGRLDHQVKIRGRRIELGEIESVISDLPEIGQCVVTAATTPAGDARLVAYVTASSPDLALNSDVISAASRRQLAEYMVPSDWIVLSEFPLNTSGKVDRKLLPAPETRSVKKALVPAHNDTERGLLALWREILGHDQIGVEDAFFDVGGNSLSAAALVARINARFGLELRVASVLSNPTIGGQAALITGNLSRSSVTTAEQIDALKEARQRRRRRGRG